MKSIETEVAWLAGQWAWATLRPVGALLVVVLLPGCALLGLGDGEPEVLAVGQALPGPEGRFVGGAETPAASGEPHLTMLHYDLDGDGLPERIVYWGPCPAPQPFAVFEAQPQVLYVDGDGDGRIDAVLPAPQGRTDINAHVPPCP